MGRGGQTLINASLDSRLPSLLERNSNYIDCLTTGGLPALSQEEIRQLLDSNPASDNLRYLKRCFLESNGNYFLNKFYKKRLRRLLQLDGESCFWCGNKILKTQTAKSQQLIKAVPDTIRDLNKDGSRILWNHVAACSSCLKQRYLINEDDSIQEWSKYCQEHYQFNINKLNGKLADYRTLNSWYTYFKHCKQQAQFQQKMDSLKDQATRNNRVPKQDRTSRLRGPARRSISERLLGQEEQTSCVWCQETLNKENITIDHIIPRSAGGSHWIKNTLPSCKRCNNDRGDLPADKYLLISKNARIDAVRERLEIINDPRMRQNHWQENHVQYGKLANKNKCSAYLIT